jgi:chemotaxis protein MotB
MIKRRKKIEEESQNHERWMVSYADFVTLLFAFFVVMYAVSEQNSEKGKKLEESVKKYLVKVGALGGVKETVNEHEDKDSPIEAPLRKYKRNQNENLKSVKGKIETIIENQFNSEEIDKIISDISNEDNGIKIVIRSEVLFDNDQNVKEGPVLQKISEIIKLVPYRVHIESHAFGGHDNWGSSSVRSTTLVKYLIKKHNVVSVKLTSVANGDAIPYLPNTKQNLDQNNRVEFVFTPEDY